MLKSTIRIKQMIVSSTVDDAPLVPGGILITVIWTKIINILPVLNGLYQRKIAERQRKKQKVRLTNRAETVVNIIKALIKHNYRSMLMSDGLKKI